MLFFLLTTRKMKLYKFRILIFINEWYNKTKQENIIMYKGETTYKLVTYCNIYIYEEN